jgi:hypothetical protein
MPRKGNVLVRTYQFFAITIPFSEGGKQWTSQIPVVLFGIGPTSTGMIEHFQVLTRVVSLFRFKRSGTISRSMFDETGPCVMGRTVYVTSQELLRKLYSYGTSLLPKISSKRSTVEPG